MLQARGGGGEKKKKREGALVSRHTLCRVCIDYLVKKHWVQYLAE